MLQWKRTLQQLQLLRKVFRRMQKDQSFSEDVSHLANSPYFLTTNQDFIDKLDLLHKVVEYCNSLEYRNNLVEILKTDFSLLTDAKRLEGIKKVLTSKEFYVLTNPDKIEQGWMLENAMSTFFVFEYWDDKEGCWAYNWWTDFPASELWDRVTPAIKWKHAEEEIAFQLRGILE